MAKLDTINILETNDDGDILSLRSFPNDESGKQEAHELFKTMIGEYKNHPYTGDDLIFFIQDRCFLQDNYNIHMVYSDLN